MIHGSVVHDLVRKTGQISVHVVSAETGDPALPRPVASRQRSEPLDLLPYAGSAAAGLCALGVGELISNSIGFQSVSLVFLTAVLVYRDRMGPLAGVVCVVLSVLAFNFFFVPPLYTFTIADPENVVALFFFALVAVIVSNLTAATPAQIVSARARAKTTAELYAFSRKVAAIGTLDDLLWATVFQVSSMLKLNTVLLLPDDEVQYAHSRVRVSPRGQPGRCRYGGGAVVLGAHPSHRARLRHIARRQMAVPAAAHRQRHGRRPWDRPQCAWTTVDAR